MNTIWHGIASVYAFLAVIPAVPFLAVWLVSLFIYKDKKKSFKLAMDVTTVLLIGSVSVMFDHIFESEFGGIWIVMLVLLLAAGLIGRAQNQKKGRVDIPRLIRMLWRMSFFVLSFVYILFLFIGIGKSIWVT